jgi:metal-responsive CopG/Arc/MetJ family transcriptional regulator
MASTRVHVVIPKELTDEIDSLVGQRRRSSFICDAAREKLIRQKQLESIRKFAGSLKDADYPEWKNGSAEWVHNLRKEDQKIRDSRVKWTSNESASDRHQYRHRRAQEKTRTR